MAQFGVGGTGNDAPPPFDIDPATGLPGGAGFPPGFADREIAFAISKAGKVAVETGVKAVERIGLVASVVGEAIFFSTAGAGEEAAIAAMVERANAIRAGLEAMNGGLQQNIAATDP